MERSGGGFGALFGVLLIIGLIIKFIWWIVGAAVLVALFFLARAIARWYAERSAAYARYWESLEARADEQHNWVLQGDDRGVYGVEGAKLMRRIRRLG
jgi:hypothetical protein